MLLSEKLASLQQATNELQAASNKRLSFTKFLSWLASLDDSFSVPNIKQANISVQYFNGTEVIIFDFNLNDATLIALIKSEQTANEAWLAQAGVD